MAALGSLVVKLALEYAQFTGGLDKSEQAALSSAKKVQDAVDGMVSSVRSRLADTAAMVAGSVVAAFSLRNFIAETTQAEQEQAQLSAVLKSTGQSAGYSRDQLNDMASALSKSSTFSAGEINKAQTRLLSYTGIVGKAVPETMQAILNMSARTGQAVEGSAETLGKAINLPSQGMASLSKMGFQFTKEQIALAERLESNGKLYEAQQIVLQELESSYGGAAAAARDTFGGAMAALKNTINDLLTGEGGSVTAMRNGVESLNESLGSPQTKEAFQTFLGWIAEVASMAVKGAANLLAFVQSSDKLAILAGTDQYGRLKSAAEAASAHLTQLTAQAERHAEAIERARLRGADTTQMERNLERTRAKIGEVQQQSAVAAQALKDFATNTSTAGEAAGAAGQKVAIPQLKTVKIDAAAAADAMGALIAKLQGLDKLQIAQTKSYSDDIAALSKRGALEQIDAIDMVAQAELKSLAATKASLQEELKVYASKTNGLKDVAATRARITEQDEKIGAREKQLVRELADAYYERRKAQDAATVAQVNSTVALADQLDQLQFEATTIGKTAAEVRLLEIARANEAAAQLEQEAAWRLREPGMEEQAYQLRLQAQLLREIAGQKGANAIAQEATAEWRNFTDSLYNGLTDSLYRSFEQGGKFFATFWSGIKNTLKSTVLKVAIQGTMTVAGSALGMSTAQAGNSLISSASTAGSLSNMMGLGSVATSIGGFGAGASAGLAGTFSGATGTMLSAGAAQVGAGSVATGLGTMIGAAAPYALAAMAVYQLLKGSGGEKRYGGGYNITDDGLGVTDGVGTSGTIQDAAVKAAVLGTYQSINSTLEALGSEARVLTSFQAGFETSGKNRGGDFAGGQLSTGEVFGTPYYQAEYNKSYSAEEAVTAFQRDLVVATLDAIKQAPDVPKAIAALLTGDVKSLSTEAGGALLAAVQAQIAAVDTFRAALSTLPFRDLAGMSFDGVSTLIADLGGMDSAVDKISSYYQNYYSEAERAAQLTSVLTDAFADLGYTLPQSRAELRDLVDANRALGEGGAPTVAALLNLQEAVAELYPSASAAAEAVEAAAETLDEVLDRLRNPQRGIEDIARGIIDLEKAGKGLLADLAEAQGDAAGAASMRRAQEIAGLSAAEVALYDYNAALREQVAAQQAANVMADAAIEKAKAMASAQMSAMDSVAASFGGLRETITLDQLGTEEKRYDYYKSQFDDLAALLPTLTSLDAINDTVAKMTTAGSNAYNQLGETGRQQQGGAFLRVLDDSTSVAQQAIQRAQEEASAQQMALVKSAMSEVADDFAKRLQGVVAEIGSAATTFSAAAQVQRQAANVSSSAASRAASRLPTRPQETEVLA